MPRTKHIVFLFAALLALLSIVLVSSALKDTSSTFSLASTERALAIEAVSGRAPGAVVAVNTVREDTRRALIERLQKFAPSENTVPAEKEEEGTLVPLPARATSSQEPLYCTDGSESGSGVMAWGPLNVTRAEGARIITSRAIADDGMPLQSLQLTDHPVIANAGTCLPKGMIGIALDGRVIEAGAPFTTSAEGIAGYALDGFAIYGPFEDGAPVTTDMLDMCHGHVHVIVSNDAPTSMYHYHVTNDLPYTIGCFKGTPIPFE